MHGWLFIFSHLRGSPSRILHNPKTIKKVATGKPVNSLHLFLIIPILCSLQHDNFAILCSLAGKKLQNKMVWIL